MLGGINNYSLNTGILQEGVTDTVDESKQHLHVEIDILGKPKHLFFGCSELGHLELLEHLLGEEYRPGSTDFKR
jgi:hypothetical protein